MFGLENYNFLKSIRFVDLLEGMKITHLSIYIFVGAALAALFPAKAAPTITSYPFLIIMKRSACHH
jgi:hypothetical protein